AQGVRQDSASVEGIWSSLFGFNTSTHSSIPDDMGISLAAALNGADILSIALEVTGSYAWAADNWTYYGIDYHGYDGIAATPNGYPNMPRIFGEQKVTLGSRTRIPLLVHLLEDSARGGTLKGFGISTGSEGARYVGQLSWDNRPRLIVTYQS